MNARFVRDSRVEQVHMLMYEHLNGYGRLFGGRLMEWIDVVAGVVARRHSGCNVTTASVDRLEFIAPAYIGDTIVLEGKITFVGRTSMEVRVDTYVEKLSGKKERINRAYLVMVALDENDKPTSVPALIPETIEEKAEYEAGKRRKAARSK
ncbi:MAG: acyl-CoA thioesterase [Clostridia bacterium]|nr:acyl-CoA thioesterase [Clostridia bacterium]